MLQNVYSLPDLIDLALMAPVVGAVNFNILHTVLQTIVKELKISDIRPWCHIESPTLAQLTLTKSKLKDAELKRDISESPIREETRLTRSRSADDVSQARDAVTIPHAPEDTSQKKEDTSSLTGEKATVKEPEAKTPEKPESETYEKPESGTFEKPPSDETELQPPPDIPTKPDDSHTEETKELPPATPMEQVETPSRDAESKKDTVASAHTASEQKHHEMEEETAPVHEEEIVTKTGKKSQRAGDAWRYTNLNRRMDGAEEGLNRLSNIVDIIADKIRKAELRKKGGPSSEELEAIDERLTELEEAMARFAADHDLLMEIHKNLNDLLAEFEAIKALAAQLKQMQIDISKKADKEETWAALALKGDLELVNTKVDQLEFETAIEELGEAIGLLGLKFTRKNDEWEERAAEIWRGIDSKMTRDVFEAAKAKIESRLTALMYGLRKLKKVVEDLLYPESSGVTRCILCRRPACISGLECIGIYGSPKRPLSDKSSGDEDSDNIKKTLDDAIAKRQKLDAPPYCESRDTIISIPYSSSSYRSSVDEKQSMEVPQIRLMPVAIERETSASMKASQIPKLPDIADSDSSSKSVKRKPNLIMGRSKSKPRVQRAELVFTKKLLGNLESKETTQQPKKVRYTAVLETEPSKKSVSRPASSKSSASSVDMTPDPRKALQSFAAARIMPDTLRRDILLSPSSERERKSNISLSPLQFDTDSMKSSTPLRFLEKEERTQIQMESNQPKDAEER